jgi:plastocyanin domain-containing protein
MSLTPKSWLRSILISGALAAPLLSSPSLRAEPAVPAPVAREIEIVVDGSYKPNRVELHEGERVRLKFVRKESNSCTKEVVLPQLNVRRELPPNRPVLIDLPALTAGEYEFKCGMNMVRGTIVVSGHRHRG